MAESNQQTAARCQGEVLRLKKIYVNAKNAFLDSCAANERLEIQRKRFRELHEATTAVFNSVETCITQSDLLGANQADLWAQDLARTAVDTLDHAAYRYQRLWENADRLGLPRPIPGRNAFFAMESAAKTYLPDEASRVEAEFEKMGLPTSGFKNPGEPGTLEMKVPLWFPVVGVVFGGITLLFLMGLVAAGILGFEVPAGTRFILVCVVAFGAALSGSFLGGTAAAKGKIPIPFIRNHPIGFTATGGVAILIIVLLIGYWTYVRGAEDVNGVLDGTVSVQNGVKPWYDFLTIRNGTVIWTNGRDFELHVRRALKIEGEATIQAFDYGQIENRSPASSGSDGTIGQDHTGSAHGTGATGRAGADGQPGKDGKNGQPGQSAGYIRLVVDGRASGTLNIINRGMDGQRGGDGGRGGNGGHGEGGGPGSGSTFQYPGGRHMGAGGRGGDGARGGDAGQGGDGGNGGSVTIRVAHNAGFRLQQLDVRGGQAGADGRPGSGGTGGQPGGGHGNGGPGNDGADGSPVSTPGINGKPGTVSLQGVEPPGTR